MTILNSLSSHFSGCGHQSRPGRKRHRFVAGCLCFLLAGCQMRNNRTEASPATDDAKDLPNKGGDDCPSAEERFTKFISGDYSTFSQSCNEVTDSDTQDQSLSLLQNENALTLTIYTSLPAYGPHLGFLVSWVVTGFLDDVSLEYKIQTITDPGDTTSQLYDALLVHQQTDPKSIYLNQSSWWWQYDLIFLCYWGSGNATNINRNFSSIGSPISDKSTLNKIQVDLKRYMAQGVESLAGLGIPEATRGLIALSQENPLNSDTPFVDHPITNFPTGAPTWGTGAPSMPAASSDLKNLAVENTYSKPIDPLLWGWREYMGLCICCATIIGTLVLTSMARDRRRRLTRQEIWGNLGTEEGVDALLQTTWKYRGDIMEVYNRGRLGYRDDDSILMGGFQQTEDLCAE